MAYQPNPKAIEHLDKIDLQLLTQSLIYWQRKADEKTKSVVAAMTALSEFYRKDEIYELILSRQSIRKGIRRSKKVEVIYQYSKNGQKTFEENMQLLEVESANVYPILLYLLEKLYYMKPGTEISTREEFTEADPEMGDQAGYIPERKVVTESQDTFARIFSFLGKPKVPNSIDDIASPYRRTHDLIDEIQNIPPLLERINSYHEFRITDVQFFGYGKRYQIASRETERYFFKSIIRPKLNKIVNAGNMIQLELEQRKIVSMIGLALREKNIHRPFDIPGGQPALEAPKNY